MGHWRNEGHGGSGRDSWRRTVVVAAVTATGRYVDIQLTAGGMPCAGADEVRFESGGFLNLSVSEPIRILALGAISVVIFDVSHSSPIEGNHSRPYSLCSPRSADGV